MDIFWILERLIFCVGGFFLMKVTINYTNDYLGKKYPEYKEDNDILPLPNKWKRLKIFFNFFTFSIIPQMYIGVMFFLVYIHSSSDSDSTSILDSDFIDGLYNYFILMALLLVPTIYYTIETFFEKRKKKQFNDWLDKKVENRS